MVVKIRQGRLHFTVFFTTILKPPEQPRGGHLFQKVVKNTVKLCGKQTNYTKMKSPKKIEVFSYPKSRLRWKIHHSMGIQSPLPLFRRFFVGILSDFSRIGRFQLIGYFTKRKILTFLNFLPKSKNNEKLHEFFQKNFFEKVNMLEEVRQKFFFQKFLIYVKSRIFFFQNTQFDVFFENSH